MQSSHSQQRPLHQTPDAAVSRTIRHSTPTKTPLPPSSPASISRTKDKSNTTTPRRSPAAATATALRNVSNTTTSLHQHQTSRPSPSPLHRSLSSASVEQNHQRRSSSPALNRRPSTTSLRNAESPLAHSPRLSSRRSSSNLLLAQLMPAVEEPVVLTAELVAAQYFARELASQHQQAQQAQQVQQSHTAETQLGAAQERTVVIIHDDCYGHRFSRLKTKDAIQSIFERPERVQASVMGIAAAFVRLGEQHGEVISESHRKFENGSSHQSKRRPFRIVKSSRKVRLHSDIVTAVHGKEWMKELQGLCNTAGQKIATATNELERSSSLNGAKKESFHVGDLYLCDESINALEGALGGVCDAVDAVFQGSQSGSGPTQAFACVRPPGHHCSSDWPSGFCWLNNVHVGIQHAIQTYGLTHAAIIDFDLHHGDGSQEITWAHNERMQFPKAKNFPNSKKSFLGYFSIHDINSFPCELGDREKTQMASLCIDNAHGQAIWNVHLEQWQQPTEFWNLYETRYKVILEKVRKFLRHRTNELRSWKNAPVPKAAIFISAGFDASEHEVSYMQRHSVNVMTEFYARFTKDIADLANEEGTAVDGRVISVLEGGYSDKALVSGVLSHISGLCHGHSSSADTHSINQLANGFDNLGISGLPSRAAQHATPVMEYNNDWWHESNIDTLVHLLRPSAPLVDKNGVKKPRVASYSTPTHSSVMKAVDPNKVLANAANAARMASLSASRAVSPPVPEVDWATAASELCKLLIPNDRQIDSLTQTDLNPPKEVKIKKESQNEAATDAQGLNGRALRERKPRASVGQDAQLVAARSRKASIDRRKTIADVPLPSIELGDKPREPRRRTSIASTVSTTSVIPPIPSTSRPAKVSPSVEVKKSRPSSTAASSRQSSVKPAGLATQKSSDADIDSLTSGLQRIKIKVPSSEEYQSRKAGPSAATKAPAAAAAAARKPVVPKATKTVAAGAPPKKSSAREAAAPKMKSTPAIAAAAPKTSGAASQPPNQPAMNSSSVIAKTGSSSNPPYNASTPLNGNTVLNHESGATTSHQPPVAAAGIAATPDTISNHPITIPSSQSNGTAQAQAQAQSRPKTSPPPYANLQWAPPNADVAKESSTSSPPPSSAQPSTAYEAGLQWMPPNSDTPIVGRATVPATLPSATTALPNSISSTAVPGPTSISTSTSDSASVTAMPTATTTTTAAAPPPPPRPQKSTPVFTATGHIPFAAKE